MKLSNANLFGTLKMSMIDSVEITLFRGGNCGGVGGRESSPRLEIIGKSNTLSVDLDQALVKLFCKLDRKLRIAGDIRLSKLPGGECLGLL